LLISSPSYRPACISAVLQGTLRYFTDNLKAKIAKDTIAIVMIDSITEGNSLLRPACISQSENSDIKPIQNNAGYHE
jgi:hypothetical protein